LFAGTGVCEGDNGEEEGRTFFWGKIHEVLLGDLLSLALFLGLAFAVVCAALDGALLLWGAFVLVGIAGLFRRARGLVLDRWLHALAVLGDV